MSQYFAQADGSPRDRPRALSTQQLEAALVNGLAVDARALGSDLAALTSAYDLSDPKCKEVWR